MPRCLGSTQGSRGLRTRAKTLSVVYETRPQMDLRVEFTLAGWIPGGLELGENPSSQLAALSSMLSPARRQGVPFV